MNLTLIVAGLALSLLMFGVPAFAHHTETRFDSNRRVTLTGTVQAFAWMNPHGRITLDVDSGNAKPGGEPERWEIETYSPGKLTRQGWTKQTVKPGDHITLEISPSRNGSRGGYARHISRVNGAAFARLKQ